jgi:hypothetical protein
MRSIDITVTITDLIDRNKISAISGNKTLPSDPDCDTDIRPITFSNYLSLNVEQSLTKTINIPILMTANEGNIGFYNGIECSGDTVFVDYQVSGTTDSNLEMVSGYLGYSVGVNLARQPFFTGVLSIVGNIITYVLNGLIGVDGYVEGTGVIYTTNTETLATTFYYDRNNQLLKIDDEDCHYIKDHFTFGEVSPMGIQNNVSIDRGDAVSVHELFFNLADHKTNEDFESGNIYEIYNN